MEKQQKQLLVAIICLCLLTTSFISSLIISASYQRSQNNFYDKAHLVYQNLIETALVNKVVLDGFVSLVGNLDEFPNYQTIRSYAQQVQSEYPHIYMLELQQAVYQEDTTSFEKAMMDSGITDYSIKSFSYEADRKWVPLPDRAIYYPLTFMEPQLPEAIDVLGLDVLSVPFLSRALNDAINHNGVFASKPFELAEGGRAYVLFKTVPNNKDIVGSILVNTRALLTYITRQKLNANISLQYPDYQGKWFTEQSENISNASAIFGHFNFERKFDDFGQPFSLVINRPISFKDINLWLVISLAIVNVLLFTLIYILTLKIIKAKQSLDKANIKLSNMITVKERLFANISHELRTPITLINAPIEQLASDKTLTEQQSKLIALAKNNGQRMFTLVERILDLSKSEQKAANLIQVNIDDLLIKYLVAFEPLMAQKNIKLEHSLTSNAVIAVDKEDIASIIENLLSNALKYTENGGWVQLNSSINNNKYLLTVSNQHSELTSEQIDKIFDRFERLGQPDSEKGFGLGLSLVKDICNRYDWRIECKSNTNEVAFHFAMDEFSIEQSETTPAQRQLIELGVNKTSQTKKSQHSVLVVEDNDELRNFIVELISNDYQVLSAVNGKDALDLAIDKIPDLIISDVMMPEIDGFSLVKALSEHDNTCHIPTIILTAKADEKSLLEGLELGAVDYITKPFEARQLTLKIKNTLERIQKRLLTQVTDEKPNKTVISERDQKFIERLNKTVGQSYQDNQFNVEVLVDNVAMSERQLQRKLKALFNQTPAEYIRNYRLIKAKELLIAGKSISLTSDFVGFNSPSYFSRSFKTAFNQSPKEFMTQYIK